MGWLSFSFFIFGKILIISRKSIIKLPVDSVQVKAQGLSFITIEYRVDCGLGYEVLSS
jgi:hypothetical protein